MRWGSTARWWSDWRQRALTSVQIHDFPGRAAACRRSSIRSKRILTLPRRHAADAKPSGITWRRLRGNKAKTNPVERGMKLHCRLVNLSARWSRSEQGMTLLQPNKAPLHMPTQAQEVYDVTGARYGDGVLAATCWRRKYPSEEACYFANAARA